MQEEKNVAMLITAYRGWWTPGAQTLAVQLAAYTDTEMFTLGCNDEVRQAKTSRASVRKDCFRTCENAAHDSGHLLPELQAQLIQMQPATAGSCGAINCPWRCGCFVKV